MFAENGDSCKQKFKFDVFTHSRILSKTSDAAVDIVRFISVSIFQIILSGKLGELCCLLFLRQFCPSWKLRETDSNTSLWCQIFFWYKNFLGPKLSLEPKFLWTQREMLESVSRNFHEGQNCIWLAKQSTKLFQPSFRGLLGQSDALRLSQKWRETDSQISF